MACESVRRISSSFAYDHCAAGTDNAQPDYASRRAAFDGLKVAYFAEIYSERSRTSADSPALL